MLTIEPHTPDNVVVGHASGMLTHEDYEDFRMRIEQMVRQHGSVRVLLDLNDFNGWEPRAAWDDLMLGLRHLGKFDRCAILGDKGWEKWMVKLGEPFFRVQYFDRSQREEAWRWLMQPAGGGGGLLDAAVDFVRRNPMLTLLVVGGLAALLLSRARPARSGA